MISGEITAFGTPGETRTHYLALRRRTLYPGELRGQNDGIITDFLITVNVVVRARRKSPIRGQLN